MRRCVHILAPGLARAVDTDATVEPLAWPHAGTRSIAGQSLDTMGSPSMSGTAGLGLLEFPPLDRHLQAKCV